MLALYNDFIQFVLNLIPWLKKEIIEINTSFKKEIIIIKLYYFYYIFKTVYTIIYVFVFIILQKYKTNI